MKKLIIKSLLVVVLLLMLALPSSAANFFSRPFLQGWSLIISTNATINYGDTNVPFASAANTNLLFSLTNTYIPATFTSVTATNYFTNNMGGASGWWTNSMTTNTAIGSWGTAWHDVPVVCNANGDVANSLALTIAIRSTNAVTGTNRMTFTFAGVASAGLYVQQGDSIAPNPSVVLGYPDIIAPETTGPGGSFVVLVTPQTPPTALTVMRTNLPAAFLQGISAIRLVKVVTDANVTLTSSEFIDSVNLSGWAP